VEYAKVKSVAKHIDVKGPKLRQIVQSTMKTISDVVGGTLGPGGQPVLIERYEHNMPSIVTKDGVTVFRSLGFDNSTAHCVMEAARDAAIHTANEAGDGTTTATILSEAIVRSIDEYCARHARVSPQRVVRHLEATYRDFIEPTVTGLSIKADSETEAGAALLRAVATVSANGDKELAQAVMECYEITGSDGNVTIMEVDGQPHYESEHVQGFPISIGYEDSCGKFYNKFINEPGSQRSVLQNPAFLLYNGRINDITQLATVMEVVVSAYQRPNDFGLDKPFTQNIVVVATGFSDMVLATLGLSFQDPGSLNVFPLQVPLSPQSNGQNEFLLDLSAVTGAPICDQIEKPLASLSIEDLGTGPELFEASRFRSNIVGFADEGLLGLRIEQLTEQLKHPESELDKMLLSERVAKLASGIARLKVFGSSNVELKEKRDRAEDAVCAVRGAIKHGVLPGGAWTLLKLCQLLPRNEINDEVFRPAFMAPFDRLMVNSGVNLESVEAESIIAPILIAMRDEKPPLVYDFLESKHVDPYKDGVLDSTPAVREAIKNALSIASLLGTLGGVVVFKRDGELERTEARASAQWEREVNSNPADERP
jgi:chaperonin GroEL